MYKLKDKYQNYDMLITTVNGRAVNLKGDPIKKVVAAVDNQPGYNTEIPGATQADLEVAFKNGNKCVIEVNDAEPVMDVNLVIYGAEGDNLLDEPDNGKKPGKGR